uniref:Uncharacterized protein n=1 Tax=Globodera rostochiensis TaxID=31243 RepID=A0A914HS80_GLORO
MKLAICNLVLESTTKPNFVADYLLYFMNKFGDFSYVDFLKMDAPSNDIKRVLLAVSKLQNITTKVYNVPGVERAWDTHSAGKNFLELFQKRATDRFLDRDLL